MGATVNIGVHELIAVGSCIQCLTIGFSLIEEVYCHVQEATIMAQLHTIVTIEINRLAVEGAIMYILLISFFGMRVILFIVVATIADIAGENTCVILEDEIDHAGDGIRTVLCGSAVS